MMKVDSWSFARTEEEMRIPYYQLDAFTSSVFAGNPAGVCLLDHWLDDRTMQAIAAENNLSETAFLVSGDGRYGLRWFTPRVEVDLCGHATLASAFVIFTHVDESSREVVFESKSGLLTVAREEDRLLMDFPARKARPLVKAKDVVDALGAEPEVVLAAERDLLAVFSEEKTVRALEPDMALLAQLDQTGVIVTAPGDTSDFVSRFFAPQMGVPEDPVTGSAHSTLIPYWADRLSKMKLRALQVSERGGELFCESRGDRVIIGGRVAPYLEGWITL